MGLLDAFSDTELLDLYVQYPKSHLLKRKLGLSGQSHLTFLQELSSRGVTLTGEDDLNLVYPDNPDWSVAEWLTQTEQLGLLCACGCGEPIQILKGHRHRGISKYRKNHRNRGKALSEKRKANISKALTGLKRDDAFKEKRRIYMRELWQDPFYQAKMSSMSTETNADPARRERQGKAISDWIARHPEHLIHLAACNRKWAAEHPEKKLDAAKRGHKALAQQGRRSSIEVKLEKALVTAGLSFEPQWEHKLGIADFLVSTTTVVFADGDYWHSSRLAQEKDARHNKSLKEQGYTVLRFWEHEINKDVQECVERIQTALRDNGTKSPN